ncbi:hypothetical protein GCM10010441_47750 [Kitasatospora paracochleata]|uniref:hypothetical protein n=1 Tax=Kitasatospora paracochleata TaxID=58354 RepID=UPI0031CE5A32
MSNALLQPRFWLAHALEWPQTGGPQRECAQARAPPMIPRQMVSRDVADILAVADAYHQAQPARRLGALPAVSLGVIPFTAQRTMWPVETFNIFDDAEAGVELLSAQMTVTTPASSRSTPRRSTGSRTSPRTAHRHGR